MAASRVAFEVKIDVHVFSESRRVVIPVCLGITKRLHDLIGPYQHVSDSERNEKTRVILSCIAILKYSLLL